MRQYTALRCLHGSFANPRAWHLNRRSVSGAVAIGLFIGWMPIPLQMVVAAFLAIIMHVNLPIAVLLVWISNPFTLPALLYAAYKTGTTLIGSKPEPFAFQASTQWIISWLHDSWQPVLVGCLFLGALSAVVGFILTRLLWRVALLRRWQDRRIRKKARAALSVLEAGKKKLLKD